MIISLDDSKDTYLSPAQVNGLNDLYIKSSFIFMCSDMVVGALSATLVDMIGSIWSNVALSIVMTLSYILYIFSVGTNFGNWSLMISCALQGACIVGYLSATNVIGDFFPLKGWVPRSVRLMILSGACEVASFIPNIFNFLIKKRLLSFKGSVWILIGTIGLFITSVILLMPKLIKETKVGLEQEDPKILAVEDGQTSSVSKEEKGDKQESLSFWKVIIKPNYFYYGLSWTILLWCMNTQNGSCISHTVKLVYGEDSGWMTFLDKFSWFGVITSLFSGYAISYSPVYSHLFYISCCSMTSLIMMLQKATGFGVICFYFYKGSLYGALGAIVTRVADKAYRGRLMCLPALFAGLIFTLSIAPLNSATVKQYEQPQISGQPPVMPLTDFSGQQKIVLFIGLIQYPLWFLWWRACRKRPFLTE